MHIFIIIMNIHFSAVLWNIEREREKKTAVKTEWNINNNDWLLIYYGMAVGCKYPFLATTVAVAAMTIAIILITLSQSHWTQFQYNLFTFLLFFSFSYFDNCRMPVQYLYQNENYDKPFFCTYFKTSLFTLYLFVMGMIAPWREACERNTNNNYTVCAFVAE